ncbi:MetQ/NlpA family ABC transporter substrate-binding protein, partial [Pseudomonas aeruginosa]|uniref:MetQ/NlpA family ABC transporter substrate-binding protein n=1 Tax=Pseudomonas aeruginosa TaxID=287 RepID=UPI0039B6C6C1
MRVAQGQVGVVEGARQLHRLQLGDADVLRVVDDIVDNPKDIRITELEAVQLARALDDSDLALGYPHSLRLAGPLHPSRPLLLSGLDVREIVIQLVTCGASPDRPSRPAVFVALL